MPTMIAYTSRDDGKLPIYDFILINKFKNEMCLLKDSYIRNISFIEDSISGIEIKPKFVKAIKNNIAKSINLFYICNIKFN
jgi:hypothetical protein